MGVLGGPKALNSDIIYGWSPTQNSENTLRLELFDEFAKNKKECVQKIWENGKIGKQVYALWKIRKCT